MCLLFASISACQQLVGIRLGWANLENTAALCAKLFSLNKCAGVETMQQFAEMWCVHLLVRPSTLYGIKVM